MKRLRLAISVLCTVLLGLGLLPDAGQAAAPGTILAVVGGASPNFPANALAQAAGLQKPGSVAVDSSGNLYIADSGNNQILKMAAGTGTITVVAGTGDPGVAGSDPGNGTTLATDAQLNNPTGIAVDASGNIYFADRGTRRVRMVNALDGTISTVAGTGVKDFTGTNGESLAATDANLGLPVAVVVDGGGNVYFSDNSGRSVRKVLALDSTIHTLAAGLKGPYGLALDSSGNLCFSDNFDHTISKVNGTDGGAITLVAGLAGANADSGDGLLAANAFLNTPEGMAMDNANNLYFADWGNSRVRMIETSTGLIKAIAGTVGSAGNSVDNVAATSALLNGPAGVALDSFKNIYIADTGNLRVRMVVSMTPVVTATPPAGTYSSAQTVTLSSNGPATIHYTLDGSNPSQNQQTFSTTGQIAISTNKTLRFYAIDALGNISAFSSLDYNFVPAAATNVIATAGNAQASVAFTAPSFTGNSTITSYTVTSTPGGLAATGTVSPIVVAGLSNNTAYTFTVTTAYTADTATVSAPSTPVTPVLPAYTLTMSLAGGSGSGSINGGASCVIGNCPPVSFLANTPVTLMASPDSDSLFSSWSPASVCSSASGNNCTVTMNAAKTATAVFVAVPKLMILGSTTPYSLFADVYTAAANNDVIQGRAVTFTGDWIVSRATPVAVFFKGGWDLGFSTSTGTTELNGKLLIRSGKLIVSHLAIK